jgi:hypothetical protein
MTDETDQPPEKPFARVQHELNQDLMQFMMGLPAVLQAQLEGTEGPVTIPPDQVAEMRAKQFDIVMKHISNIAGAAAMAVARADVLEQRISELERRLGEPS